MPPFFYTLGHWDVIISSTVEKAWKWNQEASPQNDYFGWDFDLKTTAAIYIFQKKNVLQNWKKKLLKNGCLSSKLKGRRFLESSDY